MADKMYVTVHLSKEVPDAPAGRLIFDLIKERLTDRPDVKVTGSVSNHFDQPDP